MKLKSTKPTAQQMALRDMLIAFIRPEAVNMRADEILAVLAYTVGQVLAMQDQRTMTSEMALKMISQNIEAGNAHAIESLREAQAQGRS